MSVFFYEPFYDLEHIVDNVFSEAQRNATIPAERRRLNENTPRSLKPRMDLHENAEENTVTATFEFPGVPKENIQIDVHGGKLTVSAETKQSEEHNENGYAVRERRYGKFSRTLQLPHGVKDEEIKAAMDNGVLTVTFPTSTPEQVPKKINVA